MSSSLENFRPKLRSGRVIPQGSRIIFETDDPYNQVILPMGLADLVLLCSGTFSVREIVEKIYKKQGSVPFKSILQGIHILHQGGFFENGHELTLNGHLNSWMEPKSSGWHLSWRFGQRIMASQRSPVAYYFLTLIIMIAALFGLQNLPDSPVLQFGQWLSSQLLEDAIVRVFICTSILQSARHVVRAVQMLLLTGKAYNVSLRLSIWGLHLHVGDEASDLFESKLYTTMFHTSQILVGWSFVFLFSHFIAAEWMMPLVVANMLITFWELNPFINSEALKLLQSLMVTNDSEIAAWHFETSNLIRSLNLGSFRRNQEFARFCGLWGMVWLTAGVYLLHATAVDLGPSALRQIFLFDERSIAPAAGLVMWLAFLYHLVESFIETIVISFFRPHWNTLHTRLRSLFFHQTKDTADEGVVSSIQNLPLFSHFQDSILMQIVKNSQVMIFPENTFIIIQGDPARDLFVLLEGEVEIMRQSGEQMETITELSAISIFGESALLEDSPRAAQVKAKTKVKALKIPVGFLRRVAEESQAVRQLEDFRNAILVNQFFASSPVFRSLSSTSVDFLCSRGTLEYYDAHQVVFNQGDAGDSIFMILRGSVEIEVNGVTVKPVSQGSFFGEIALIANLPRTGTVITNQPCVFFRISADAFWEVLVQHIDLGVFLETVSENRLLEDLSMAQGLRRTGSDS